MYNVACFCLFVFLFKKAYRFSDLIAISTFIDINSSKYSINQLLSITD